MGTKERLNRFLAFVCIGVLAAAFVSVLIRFAVRQIVILRMGVENELTSLVFFDNPDMATAAEARTMVYGQTDDRSIDWALQYPFSEDNDEVQDNDEVMESAAPKPSLKERYVQAVQTVQEKLKRYTQQDLAGYAFFTKIGNRIESLFGWNFTAYSEYNGIIRLSDGYWTSVKPKIDMQEHLDAMEMLQRACLENGADLLYIQAPFKVSKYEDTDISGQLDYSNQNADELLSGLREKGIDTLDLREVIHESGFSHHKLFYSSDHHWKTETGLWAAGKISRYLNRLYSLGMADVLDPDSFEQKVYPDWFLGSYGKKLTLGKAEPDDFTLLYPRFETDLHLEIPSIHIDLSGDFSILYNMEAVEPKDYEKKSSYAAYDYGDRAITRIHNRQFIEEKKILIIHDSFANCVIPFLALTTGAIESVDLRYFNGSLQVYLQESHPDIVVVMYNAGDVSKEINSSTHTDIFDFR